VCLPSAHLRCVLLPRAAGHLPGADARPDAWFYLGVMHMRGYGVRRKSVQRALTYFTLAAQSGNPLAQYNAAVMHMAGKGTARCVRG
jgi:SEL1 protein